MLKKWMVSFLVVVMLLITPSAWAQEMESGGEEDSRLHLHGHGELHYNSQGDGGTAKMDMHQLVFGMSYDFSDFISVHTEIDFDHAAQEMNLEFAYLDFRIDPSFNFRAGSMLMPIGPLNEFHEPPLFYSVERPNVQSLLIPTTWAEGGAGIFGSLMGGLRYRVYIVSGLAAEGFSAEKGIRDGRGKVAGGENQIKTGEELAIAGRLEYAVLPGMDLGFSIYEGGANQDSDAAKNQVDGDPSVGILEGDVRVRLSAFDFQAVYVQIDIDDADKINTKFPGKNVAEKMVGWYVELAYHLAPTLGTAWDLVPFVRIETVNTQDEVPVGAVEMNQFNRKFTTYGLAYYPHPQVVWKADFQNEETETGGDVDTFNLGIGYMF